jgi:hypothetical protein
MEFKVSMVIIMDKLVCKSLANKQLSIYNPALLGYMGESINQISGYHPVHHTMELN